MFQRTAAPVSQETNDAGFSDAQLLVFVGQGKDWALRELYERYSRLVFLVALRMLNDRASAEEIVQQVYTQIWRRADTYRAERGKFSTWLMSITHHLCIDEIRRRRVRAAPESDDDELLLSLESKENLAEAVQSSIEQASVRKAMMQIPAEQRTVIELSFWGGLTHEEIATRCHAPLGTVKTRLRLGMQKLKPLLQDSV